MTEHLKPSAEQFEAARSPVSYLSDEQLNEHRGKAIAILLDGPDKGTVIADARLDDPNCRTSIRNQVKTSKYAERRYQLRQILDTTKK